MVDLTPSELGRHLSALSSANAAHPVVCDQCGRVFEAHNVRARWCSGACRQKAKYQKAKAQRER